MGTQICGSLIKCRNAKVMVYGHFILYGLYRHEFLERDARVQVDAVCKKPMSSQGAFVVFLKLFCEGDGEEGYANLGSHCGALRLQH